MHCKVDVNLHRNIIDILHSVMQGDRRRRTLCHNRVLLSLLHGPKERDGDNDEDEYLVAVLMENGHF